MFRVSLRTVVIITVAVVAVAAAVIAVLPMYLHAFWSAEETAGLFARSVTNYLSSELTGLTQRIETGLDTMDNSVRRLCVNLSDSDSVIGLIGYAYTSTNTSASLFLDNGKYFNFAVQSVLNVSVVSPDPEVVGVATVGDTTRGMIEFSLRYLTNFTLATSFPQHRFTQPNPYNVTVRPFFQAIRSGRGWTEPFVDVSGLFASRFSGMPVFDGYDSKMPVGAMGIKLVVENNVVAFAKDMQVAQTGRVLLLDVTSRTYFGGSTNDASVIRMPNGSLRLATLSDSVDPVVVGAIGSIPNGIDAIYTCKTPCDLSSVQWSGTDLGYFVRVESIQTTAPGLAMRVVVMIPADDFIGDMRSAARTSIIAAACSVVALVAVSAVTIMLLMQPLEELEGRLLHATDFMDGFDNITTKEEADESSPTAEVLAQDVPNARRLKPSRLKEVFSIQQAYMALHQELKKVKSFLPQSVLRQLEEVREGDDILADATAAPNGSREWLDGNNNNNAVPTSRGRTGAGVALSPPMDGVLNPLSSMQEEERGTPTTHAITSSLGSSPRSTPAEDGGLRPQPRRTRRGTTEQPKGVNVPATRTIRADLHLSSRRVTILMCNVNRFHSLLDVVGPQVLQRCHGIVVDHILAAVHHARGVVESFFGDHFMISLNASVPCTRAPTRAAKFIAETSTMLLHAAADYGDDGSTVPWSQPSAKKSGCHAAMAAKAPWSIRVGCATGPAICGNFGSDRMRRFSALGPVVSHASALMAQCRPEGVSNAVDEQTFHDAAHDVPMEHINFVVLPHAKEGRLISTVLDRQLLMAADRAPTGGPSGHRLEALQLINEAFSAFSQGDIVTAKEIASRVPREHNGGIYKCLRSVMQSLSALP